jgi:hypothetical protein
MRDPLDARRWAALGIFVEDSMAERKHSGIASEELESETHRYKRGTPRSEKGSIESRKQEIAAGLSETRERGERVLKEMRERAVKKMHGTK